MTLEIIAEDIKKIGYPAGVVIDHVSVNMDYNTPRRNRILMEYLRNIHADVSRLNQTVFVRLGV